ncbi:MAG: UDP-N-acetylglucosamine 2-epimerase (non-hydrolyzing) [bacterium]|nr:UDP-N-acetylglucosamine 2-epimerase (non-hydrolyzing) [bacterium]
MKKILTIIGARPQFVKAAVVSRAMQQKPVKFKEIIVHTGQHYDANMSQVFFDEMQIPTPDYHLEIGGGSHGEMTGKMLIKIEEVIVKEKPDVVLVYGDTNSTLAGALAAVKLHIPVAHVEAGLRSYNRMMPEEHNRVLTDHVSDYLFCPTETAVENLSKEGLAPCALRLTPQVFNTGDVMYDAFLFYSELAKEKSTIIHNLNLEDNDFILCTIHRAENTDDQERLRNIFEALNEIAQEKTIILPMHPRTRKILSDKSLTPCALRLEPNLQLIDPVSYFDMLMLLKNSQLVMTDSGGVQKEAFYAKKPCVTMRDETEWVETVTGGYNMIVGANKERILSGSQAMMNCQADFSQKLYGNGAAGELIVQSLIK